MICFMDSKIIVWTYLYFATSSKIGVSPDYDKIQRENRRQCTRKSSAYDVIELPEFPKTRPEKVQPVVTPRVEAVSTDEEKHSNDESASASSCGHILTVGWLMSFGVALGTI
ncbi:hypothetical protein MAR_021316 [Mya arenaria]|uniref:Uncharacterized protein n=1 Tax=Mya arenaria TaxID=6604 RepID=A0ABY7E7F7_MYAAR|nr:hypothetical protein MAR_021316 [Mya arenaria]